MNDSICRMCGAVGTKMAKAHILPKSFYGDLIEPEGPALLLVPPKDERVKKSRIGVYDQTILCLDCEAEYSDIDNYAFEIFFRAGRVPVFYDKNEPHAERIAKISPDRLRLFFVFLIWRMGVTEGPMFRAMKLGRYLESCRRAVVERNAGLVPELDVVVSRFTDDEHGGMLGPTRLRIEGVNGYRVHFVRHVCWLKIDKRAFPTPFDELSISDREYLHILLRDFEGSPERRAMAQHVKQRAWT